MLFTQRLLRMRKAYSWLSLLLSVDTSKPYLPYGQPMTIANISSTDISLLLPNCFMHVLGFSSFVWVMTYASCFPFLQELGSYPHSDIGWWRIIYILYVYKLIFLAFIVSCAYLPIKNIFLSFIFLFYFSDNYKYINKINKFFLLLKILLYYI